jgi:hypothetical protein
MMCSPVEQHGLRMARPETRPGVSDWPATGLAAQTELGTAGRFQEISITKQRWDEWK